MKLGSEYKLYTVSQNTTLNVDELIYDCMNFLRAVALDQETFEKLSKVEEKLRQTEKLENTDKVYKHKKEILFQDIFDIFGNISPEGCYFGTHPANLSLIGFWDKRLFSVTR
jgi:glucose dehydrogenase